MLDNFGFMELVAIVALVFIVLGPEKIPEAARTIGQFIRWKRSMEHEVRTAINPLVRPDDLVMPSETKVNTPPQFPQDTPAAPPHPLKKPDPAAPSAPPDPTP